MAGVPQYAKDKPNLLQVVTSRFTVGTDKTGKVAFTLPKGAIVCPSSFVNVKTAFDAGTAQLGVSGTTAALFASADIAPTVQAAFKPIVNATVVTGATFNVPLAADTDVIWTVATATSGVLIACIVFVYPMFLTDLL